MYIHWITLGCALFLSIYELHHRAKQTLCYTPLEKRLQSGIATCIQEKQPCSHHAEVFKEPMTHAGGQEGPGLLCVNMSGTGLDTSDID